MRELIEIGFMTTPVTVIDGEVVVGFNAKTLEELIRERVFRLRSQARPVWTHEWAGGQ